MHKLYRVCSRGISKYSDTTHRCVCDLLVCCAVPYRGDDSLAGSFQLLLLWMHWLHSILCV